MSYLGTLKGNLIELDERPPLPEGSRVEVTLTHETVPPRSSPRAVLQLVGTLTHEEAEVIRKGAAAMRRVDPGLWRGRER
jgi:hypothetical protein